MESGVSLSASMNNQPGMAPSTQRRQQDTRAKPRIDADVAAQNKAQAKHYASLRRYFADSLKRLFNAKTRQKTQTNVQITPFLMGAELVWGNTHADNMPSIDGYKGITYVIADKRFPGRAVIVSYEHHRLQAYKDLMERLNPDHDCRHKLAPTVEYCSDTYTRDGKKSGRLIAVSGFDHLDLAKIDQDRRIPSGVRKDYLEIMRQLKAISCEHRQLTKQAKNKPGVR